MGNPYLYILMRTDLASLNPGKQCAHAAHAANMFEHRLRTVVLPESHQLPELVNQWNGETGGQFGVTICLGVNEQEMRTAVMIAENFEKAGLPVLSGIVHDPSYPLQDGVPKDGSGKPTFSKIHLIPLDTCGYVFGDKETVAPFLGHLKLMA